MICLNFLTNLLELTINNRSRQSNGFESYFFYVFLTNGEVVRSRHKIASLYSAVICEITFASSNGIWRNVNCR